MDTKRKLLIVDDEQGILNVIYKSLPSCFDVHMANSGAKAIQMFDKINFDLVITDVRMPGIDGLQLLRTIKKLYVHCEIILITGFSETQLAVDALNEGAFAFVTKPINFEILIQRLHQALAIIQNRENQDKVLKEMKNELLMQTLFAQRLSALAAMSGGIAHELHQPLSGIGIYAATLQNKIKEENQINSDYLFETLSKIIAQVERAAKVIDHMKSFSSGDNSDEIVTINLKETVEKSLELFNVQLKTSGISLKLDIPSELYIKVNPNRFEQVLVNLLSNSKDSLIEKSLRSNLENPEKTMLIRCFENKDWIIMDISDNGLGVPLDIQKTLFEAFVTTKKNAKGSGLGLAICKRILLDYSAKIELSASNKEGTTFRISFSKKTS